MIVSKNLSPASPFLAIGYCIDRQLLEFRLKNQPELVFRYCGVPPSVFDDMPTTQDAVLHIRRHLNGYYVLETEKMPPPGSPPVQRPATPAH